MRIWRLKVIHWNRWRHGSIHWGDRCLVMWGAGEVVVNPKL